MLYSFLSESGVLDISLLALGTGIIVLSILGLLHLGKRRGHNKAGHFSEQRKIAMDGPRWNNLRQLNLYPLSLHLKILQISILRLPKRSYPKSRMWSRSVFPYRTYDGDVRWHCPTTKKHFLSGWITTSAPRFMSVPLRNGKSLKSWKKSAASDWPQHLM